MGIAIVILSIICIKQMHDIEELRKMISEIKTQQTKLYSRNSLVDSIESGVRSAIQTSIRDKHEEDQLSL